MQRPLSNGANEGRVIVDPDDRLHLRPDGKPSAHGTQGLYDARVHAAMNQTVRLAMLLANDEASLNAFSRNR
jgi:hypothetical protein